MVLRIRKIVSLGSVALLASTVLLMAGPLSGTASASASPCKRWGSDNPRHLSKRQARAAVRCLLNRKRENHGLRRLGKSSRLKKAAQRHTKHMKRNRCFAHECPGEPSVLSRLKRVNYIHNRLRRWSYGENIAYGGSHMGSPKKIVRAWMHSAGHRHNILNPDFREIGVGVLFGIPPKPGANGTTFTSLGSAAAMAVRAHDLALVYLVQNALPAPARQLGSDRKRFVA
jgi:uncharacterized protein YkwD